MKFPIQIVMVSALILGLAGCATSVSDSETKTVSQQDAKGRLGYVKSKSQDVDFQKFDYQFSMDMDTTIKLEKADHQFFNLCKIYSGEPIPTTDMLASCTQAIAAGNATQKTKTASYYHRGLIHQKLERLADARSDFIAATKLDSDFGDGFLALASLSMLENDVETARLQIETALTKNVKHPAYAHYLLGHALEADRKFIDAREEYRQALALRPNWRAAKKRIERINISWPETEGLQNE